MSRLEPTDFLVKIMRQVERDIQAGNIPLSVTSPREVLVHLERLMRWKYLMKQGRKVGKKMVITSEYQVYNILSGQ